MWRLLLPFSWLYGLGSGFIRLCYKIGWKQAWIAPIPVVVVGNLTIGGNGKTPFVIWLIEQLHQYGIRVGVVSRGYNGKSLTYPLLLNKQTTTNEAGDEPVLIYQRTGAPVAVAPKRKYAVQALISQNNLQMIISDDGLQHYALARDIEIVVIDGVRRFGNGWWLPAGPMRERASRLQSVDAVIVNGGAAQGREISMQTNPGLAVNLLTGEKCNVSELNNLVAMAGIGYPQKFFFTLKRCGAKVVKHISLTDHQVLKIEKINTFTHPGQMLIMTEKDAVKYRAFAKENWWYLPINVEIRGDRSKHLIKHLVSLAKKKRDIV